MALAFALFFVLIRAALRAVLPERSWDLPAAALAGALMAKTLSPTFLGKEARRGSRVGGRRRARQRAIQRQRQRHGLGPIPFTVELHAEELIYDTGKERARLPWRRVRSVRRRNGNLEILTFRHFVVVQARAFANAEDAEAFRQLVERLVREAGRARALEA
jgi:hypothetical protein